MALKRGERVQQYGGEISDQAQTTRHNQHRAHYAGIQRPKRWRGPNTRRIGRRIQQSSEDFTPVLESCPTSFSISQGSDISAHTTVIESQRDIRRKNSLIKSFSQLLTNNANGQSLPNTKEEQLSQSDPSQEAPLEAPFVPHLSRPKKQREGYGFSYSETFMRDSDEFPDTEGDTEANTEDEQEPRIPVNTQTRNDQGLRHQTLPASPPDSTSGFLDGSFEDIVVLRDVGSFHIARPQRKLSCTMATREDALRSKVRAKTLTRRYRESGDIQAGLLERLERMVLNEQQNGAEEHEESSLTFKCAQRLHHFLVHTKEGRIDTGEPTRLVDHQLEWAGWLVEASRSGVLHLRTRGCDCRPDWEESNWGEED